MTMRRDRVLLATVTGEPFLPARLNFNEGVDRHHEEARSAATRR
ncbi:hypothetical protein [Sorangium sp. So ce861]